MGQHFPAAPADMEVINIFYRLGVPFQADNPPFGLQLGLTNLTITYNFVEYGDNNVVTINSAGFDQDTIEHNILLATTEMCGLIAGFTNSNVEDVFGAAVIDRSFSFSTPELILTSDPLVVYDPLPFTPVTS